jgi:hypothetical protein
LWKQFEKRHCFFLQGIKEEGSGISFRNNGTSYQNTWRRKPEEQISSVSIIAGPWFETRCAKVTKDYTYEGHRTSSRKAVVPEKISLDSVQINIQKLPN